MLRRQPDGWGYTGGGMLWGYQPRAGLKPIGWRRRVEDELLPPLVSHCAACDAYGVVDAGNGEGPARLRGVRRAADVPGVDAEGVRLRRRLVLKGYSSLALL